ARRLPGARGGAGPVGAGRVVEGHRAGVSRGVAGPREAGEPRAVGSVYPTTTIRRGAGPHPPASICARVPARVWSVPGTTCALPCAGGPHGPNSVTGLPGDGVRQRGGVASIRTVLLP